MGNISKLSKIPNIISYLQVGSLWILLIALHFRWSTATRGIMIAAGVLFFSDYFASQRWKSWRWEYNKWLYVAMIAYYLFIPIWQFFSDTYEPRYFSYTMGMNLALLLGGLLGILGFSDRVKLRHIGYVMLFSCLINSFYIIFKAGGFDFFAHSLQEQSAIFRETRIRYVAFHMIYNLYMNVSLVFALYLLRQKDIKLWIRIAVIAATLWIFYLLCITEGRIGLFTALLMGATYLFVYFYQRGRKWFLMIIIAYIAMGTLIVTQHKRFESDMLKDEPRWLIWQASLDIIREKPLMGHGVCDAKAKLTEKALVGEGGLQDFYRSRITDGNIHRLPHPHNAFLQAWSNFGLIGLITIMFIFSFPLTMKPKNNRLYLFMITGCFVIQNMTDIFFAPQPLLYCLAIMFFTSEKTCYQSISQAESGDFKAVSIKSELDR